MKISYNWLSELLDWKESDPQKIADTLCVSTAEIDEVIDQSAALDGCSLGKIDAIVPHPDADKLVLCDVSTDQGTKRVVCGGSNLREGMYVAFAHIGTTVKWHGTDVVTIEKAKIRGEFSEGMICTAEELELTESFPESKGSVVIDFGDGPFDIKPLAEHLRKTDYVFDIDNHGITHRADLFSHRGFARECIALGLAKWKKGKEEVAAAKGTKDDIPFGHVVDCKEKVPRYLSCMIEIEDTGETPEWMIDKLEATGWRSLNLPVDITNYVSMETGMPLHSFDADDLKGDIHMRLAKKGEKIVTLDKEERELPEGAIVLSDDDGIFDLLGIMGGLRSSTKENTRRVYLHSAIIDPVSIRNAIIATGHRTDASTVYEKGIPPITAEIGFNKAVELFLELVPGAKVVSKIDTWGDEGKADPIELDPEYVNTRLGVDLKPKRMEEILTALGFTVEKKKDIFSVTPPLWRIGDIENKYDLIEEVARIYGFNNIEDVLPQAHIDPPVRDIRPRLLREALKDRGYFELLPLSMIGPRDFENCLLDPSKAVEIKNAIGEELSLMQTSNLPQLLNHAERSLRDAEGTLSTFVLGNIFKSDTSQTFELGTLVSAQGDTSLLDDPFLTAKTNALEALSNAGYIATVRTLEKCEDYMHPGRSAEIVVDNTVVGTVFEAHPTVRANFDLPGRSAASLINLDTLFELKPVITIQKPLPHFPSVSYDITVPLESKKNIDTLLLSIRASSDLVEDVSVKDMYASEKDSNVTLSVTYRSSDRTLTDEETKKEFESVEKLCSQY